ncbi:MAG: hypothetical protein OXC60_16725 [Litoreibacter sp.]|nr:hypothetical protein [Litoreibacter sp.]
MTNDWIIDVLTDLRKFSASNSLDLLADRLDDTIQVAAREIDIAQSLPLAGAGMSDVEQDRRHAGRALTGNNP